MIYRDTPGIQPVLQNNKLGYAFLTYKNYQLFSKPLDKVDLGYVAIGPTMLVEWIDD